MGYNEFYNICTISILTNRFDWQGFKIAIMATNVCEAEWDEMLPSDMYVVCMNNGININKFFN